MPATVQIGEKNGAGGTFTDKTSGTIRLKTADDATVNSSNPINVPPSGTNYSYEKWLRLKCTVAPSVQITNAKFYTDGANGFGTGIGLYAKAVTSFSTPALGSSTTGYSDAFGYTSGAALALNAGTVTATGEFGDHTVLLMTVASTATQGQLTTETLTWSYDEI